MTGSAGWTRPGRKIWPPSWFYLLTLPPSPNRGEGWRGLEWAFYSVVRGGLRPLLLILDDVNFDICLCVSPDVVDASLVAVTSSNLFLKF